MYMSMTAELAKNLGVSETALQSKIDEVLAENKSAWLNAGKDEETCLQLAARVAGRQLKVIGDKAAKSGCVAFEGIFIRVPPYKDWGRIAYTRMERELNANGLNDITTALIRTGNLVYFEASGEGYTKHFNPSLNGNSFSEGIDTVASVTRPAALSTTLPAC